jgi:hypothetical protein
MASLHWKVRCLLEGRGFHPQLGLAQIVTGSEGKVVARQVFRFLGSVGISSHSRLQIGQPIDPGDTSYKPLKEPRDEVVRS